MPGPGEWALLLVTTTCLLPLGSWAVQEAGKPTGVDLTKATLNQTLSQLPADGYVLMEFYATWCPACRAFKADYDKVARFLQSQPNSPSKVHAFRLDCAIDQDVCGSYKVQAYPSMYAGRAEDMMAVELSKLGKFDYGKYSRNAVGVVKFVADHFKINDLVFVDVAEPTPAATAKGTGQWVAADIKWTEQDVQLATNELISQITSSKALHSSLEQRDALVDLLKLFEGFHPSDTCRSGATESLQQLNKLWPAGKSEPDSDLKSLSVCGDCAGHDSCSGGMDAVEAMLAKPGMSSSTSSAAHAPPAYIACKGSKPDSRGYTCALWLLFHTIAGRLPEDGGAPFIKAMQGFGHHFFQCAVCKKHFERCVDSPEAAAVKSRRDAVLWTWHVHNEVNARLEWIEHKYGHSSTGDPEWPKMQWPVLEACPQCRLPVQKRRSDERGGGDGGRRTGEAAGSIQDSVQWNEEEVYRHLMKWYGGAPGDGNKIVFERFSEGAAGTAAGAGDGALPGSAGGTAAAYSGTTSSLRGVLLLAMVASVVFYLLYGRSQRRRHAVKGPGAVQRLHHGKGHVGAGGGGAANGGGESWGGARYGTRKISTG